MSVGDGSYENLDVEVRILVEVDGHLLRFTADGKAVGARYHGATPKYSSTELERSIRGTVDTLLARAGKQADTAVARLYPLAEDRT